MTLDQALEQARAHIRDRLAHVRARLLPPPVPESRPGDPLDAAVATEERELSIAARSSLLDHARRLEAAEKRLDEGRYGICDDCEGRIPDRRLLLLPEAERCVACQIKHERAEERRRRREQ